MTSHDWLILATFVFEAIFWLGAYALIIKHSFGERIHAMPVVAMCGNISWEFILGLGLFPACPAYWANCPAGVMGPVTMLAALMDAFILYTIIRFGRSQFQTPFIRKYFAVLVLLGVALASAIIFSFMSEMYTENIFAARVGDTVPAFLQAGLQGGIYTGWGLALMMAILFIAMLISRGDVRGQSFYIALFMGLGNLGAYLFDHTAAAHMPTIVNIMAVASMTLNAVYAVLVYRRSRALGIDPLRRL
jgi:hypothetical protein